MSILPAYVYVHQVCGWYSQNLDEGVRSPGTRIADCCVCWEPNPGPQQEQQVLLTTEPSFHSLFYFLNSEYCMSVCLSEGLHMSASACRGQGEGQIPWSWSYR